MWRDRTSLNVCSSLTDVKGVRFMENDSFIGLMDEEMKIQKIVSFFNSLLKSIFFWLKFILNLKIVSDFYNAIVSIFLRAMV